MKKSLLLLAAIFAAGLARGQGANSLILSRPASTVYNNSIPHSRFQMPPARLVGQKTTTPTAPRWYNYGGQYQYLHLAGYDPTISQYTEAFPFMWFDTSSKDIYTDTPHYRTNHLLSFGEVYQPWFGGFNDTSLFGPGVMAMTSSIAYSIDSIEVVGIYQRNPSTPGTVYDTLRFSWVEGDGISGDITLDTSIGHITYPLDSPFHTHFLAVVHDSTYNVAKWANHLDLLLGPADVTDTDGTTYRGGSMAYTGFVHKRLAMPGAFSVPAGHYFAVTCTYKSGDATAPHMPPGSLHYGDTVYTGHTPGAYRYDMFRPLVAVRCAAATPTTIAWPDYDPSDFNEGIYKSEVAPSWGGTYIPMWAYSAPTGHLDPSTNQYTTLGIHIQCPTCPITGTPRLYVNTVTDLSTLRAYPNPANNELTVACTLATGATALVTLTNMVGQVVSTNTMTNGKAVFNTNTIPVGLYIYSVQTSEGTRATGRVVIAH